SRIPLRLGGIHAGERADHRRCQFTSPDPETGNRRIVAARPVQRCRRHQQSESGIQLDGFGRYRPDYQRLLGLVVPCAEFWRVLADLERGMEWVGTTKSQ